MATDAERMKQLATAGSFCLFDKKLRSSGNSSIIWGLLNVLIGALVLARDDNWGAVSVVLGLALIAAGAYQRKVRDPKVVILSAATLGALALWNFVLIGLAAIGNVQLASGGRILFWAIAQAWGAYGTWKTYSTYKALHEKSDPMLVEQLRGHIEELQKAKPEQSLDLVEFEVNAGFVEGRKCYRLKPMDDLYLFARYKSQFSSLQLEDIGFVLRNQVKLTPEGEKWMSKKIRASVQLGPQALQKVTVTQEMAARINPGVRAIALGST